MAKKRAPGEGSIQHLPSGSWRARIGVDGTRKSATFDTQKKAREWLTQIRRELDTDSYIEASERSLGDWWKTWIQTYKANSVSPATMMAYSYSRARLPASLFSRPISRIATADIQKELNAIAAHSSRRTVEMTRTHLSMCFDRAVMDKLIRSNPVKNTVLPAREPGEKASVLTYEEEDALVEYCRTSSRPEEQTMKDCLFLIMRTGARSSEAINIRWSDYNLKKLHIRGTKTAGSDRYIPLCDDAVAMMERRAMEKHRPDDLVFPTRKNHVILRENLLRKMKLFNGHTVKDLRHTYATRAAEGGINPKVLQLLLGHARIETTLSYYTHISEEAKVDAVNKIASGWTRVGHEPAKITQIAK